MLWMQHQDGIRGWNKWEEMFEATLKEEFEIRPNVVPQRVASRTAAPPPVAPVAPPPVRPVPPAQPVPRSPPAAAPAPAPAPAANSFSMASLASLARARKLTVDDLSDKNGNLWVRTDDSDLYVNKVLLDWKFTYRRGKGWWR
jgi:hypothetical protein